MDRNNIVDNPYCECGHRMSEHKYGDGSCRHESGLHGTCPCVEFKADRLLNKPRYEEEF